MTNWINNRFGTNFIESDLNHIKDFSLLWNIFEDIVCDNDCNITLLKIRLESKTFNLSDFQTNFEYFQNRYITDNNTNERFEHLNINNARIEQTVKDVLLGSNDNVSEIVLALSIIVYRYRNNLFHGRKDITTINEQNENFLNANQVLISILNEF